MQQLLQSPSSRSGRIWPPARGLGLGRLGLWRLALVPVAFSVSGCAAIEGIFKAGVWVGVIAVAIVLAVAFGLVRLMSK